MIKVLRIFLYTDMRLAHDGLTALAKEEDINLETMQQGEFVMFMNTNLTRMKLFTCNGILAYMRSPTGKPMDLRAVAAIPKAFMATGKIEYDKSLEKMLEKKLELVDVA